MVEQKTFLNYLSKDSGVELLGIIENNGQEELLVIFTECCWTYSLWKSNGTSNEFELVAPSVGWYYYSSDIPIHVFPDRIIWQAEVDYDLLGNWWVTDGELSNYN